MTINYDKLLEGYSQNCKKLNDIHKEINNVKYFGLCQSTERILWNLVYDIAEILEVDEDELGLDYWEDDVK
jgi:plasmid rolling circle replication initiator protein Rep